MSRPFRTFVALRCAPAIGRRLRRECERLGGLAPGLRAPGTDDFHTTLHFLGDTDEGDLGRIGRALRAAAAENPPLELVYRGLGAFPTPERARVVWAGVEAPYAPDALGALAAAVGANLAEVGYPPEARRFHAHVTLGRFRRPPGEMLARAVAEGRNLTWGEEEVSDLRLILSPSGNRGYRYIDLTTVPLGRMS